MKVLGCCCQIYAPFRRDRAKSHNSRLAVTISQKASLRKARSTTDLPIADCQLAIERDLGGGLIQGDAPTSFNCPLDPSKPRDLWVRRESREQADSTGRANSFKQVL